MSLNILICPVCLKSLEKRKKQFVCCNNHSFDIAKQGYVNLLQPWQRHSKNPGDNSEMIKTRTAFLNKDFYRPMIDQLILMIKDLNLSSDDSCLDSGCGEGYYTEKLQKKTLSAWYGLDISRAGILTACRRDSGINWLVASSKKLPFKSNSVKVITSLFSFIDTVEFKRCLPDDGVLYTVTPGTKHLHQLRSILYDEVIPFNESKIVDRISPDFNLIMQKKITVPVFLKSTGDILNLAKMTPHYWRAKSKAKESLKDLHQLKIEADFCINMFTPAL